MNPNSNVCDKVPRAVVIVGTAFCLLEAAKLTVFCAAQPAVRALDAKGYWRLGEQVAAGDLWMVHDPVAFRTPGYPWFLGLAQALFGRYAWFAVVAIQYLTVWLTTLLTGWWTWKATGRPWLAVLAIAICLGSAARASFASTLLGETMFALLLTLTIFFFSCDRWLESSFPKAAVLDGIMWAISWIIRPVSAALVPAWLVAMCLSRSDNSPMKRRLLVPNIAITVVLLVAILGPWVIRNTVVFHRTSLTVFLGRELWITTFGPGLPAAPPMPESEASKRLIGAVLTHGEFDAWEGNWTVHSRLREAGLSDVEADELMRRVAQEAILQNPLRIVSRGIWREIDFWRSVYSRPMVFHDDIPERETDFDGIWNQPQFTRFRDAWLNQTWESRLLTVEVTSLLALLGVVGLWLSPITWRLGAVITAALLGMALLTAALEYPSYRYRMVLEPTMIVSAVAGWNVIVNVLIRGTKALWREAGS